MSRLILYMAMSLDGFITGPGDDKANPAGVGGMRLQEWLGDGGPEVADFRPSDRQSQIVFDEMLSTGAVITGRRTGDFVDYWGGDHHDGVPIFVPTHTAPAVGAGPKQAESAALIDPLAPTTRCPTAARATSPTRTRLAARCSLLDAGFASVAMADIAFDVDFESEDDAVAAQLPAGPVAAAVRHSGRAAVEAALRSFFAPRSRADGTVRMGLVFRCYLAERAR